MDPLEEIFGNNPHLEPAMQLFENDGIANELPADSKSPDKSEETFTYGLNLFSMSELMAREYPDALWVVDGLIPEGITVMSAQPASFKTWLLLDIATSVATGGTLFGHFPTQQTSVLMIDEENSARLLQERLKMLDAEYQLPIFFLVGENFTLDNKHVEAVIEFCEDNGIELITFDSLVRIHQGNENDSSDMSKVFAQLRRFTKAGINVLVTHHNRKSTTPDNLAQEMRGSSDILAAVDCHIAVSRDEKHHLVLTQTKLRFAEEYDPIEVEIVVSEDHLAINYTGTRKPPESKKTKTIAAIVAILETATELNQKELLAALDEAGHRVNAKTLRDRLNELVTNNRLTKSSGAGSEIRYSLVETTEQT